MVSWHLSLALAWWAASCSSAQGFPPPPTYSTILRSSLNPNVTVSYTSPENGTCATVFETQEQYTGYISLPAGSIPSLATNYTTNLFFWFVEARVDADKAPLTVWLGGNPGTSSMAGLFQEIGPCEVVQMSDGNYGTQPRLWGWDRASNLLFIDQPAQAGFSYDSLRNASYDILRGDAFVPPQDVPVGTPAYGFLNGTGSSGEVWATANSSVAAAHGVWHFMQAFLPAFPKYRRSTGLNSTTVEISLATSGYGGVYGPTIATVFEQENNRTNSSRSGNSTALEIRLANLIIMNGMVDLITQVPSLITFPTNNTYGLTLLDESLVRSALTAFHSPAGCESMVAQCQSQVAALGTNASRPVSAVDAACASAQRMCARLQNSYLQTGRSPYDIRYDHPLSFPSSAYLEYLNDPSVQRSIGAAVNLTAASPAVAAAFNRTGDPARVALLPALAGLLARNTRVALLYGDADYLCNWQGGQSLALALAALSPAHAVSFPAAGYADLAVNQSYVGGAVRQSGALAFARVYDAGHRLAAYQPETAFTLFARVLQGAGLATGQPLLSTTGPSAAAHVNRLPRDPAPSTCWVRDLANTCSAPRSARAAAGEGVVAAGVWYERPGDVKLPAEGVTGARPGHPWPNGTVPGEEATGTEGSRATGVFTATGVPRSAAGGLERGGLWWSAGLGLVCVLAMV